MSVKVMGRVWDADLKPNLKLVLLAYADAAEHDGTEIWPGWDRIARMTNYSRPSVARLTADLLTIGVLIQIEPGHSGQRASYRIDLDHPIMRVSQDDTQPPDPERVSNQTERVSNQDESVSPVIPLPSSTSVLSSRPLSEAETAAQKVGRLSHSQVGLPFKTGIEIAAMSEHDKLVWALVAAMGWDHNEITEPTWGRLHRAAKDLEAVEANPADVARRAQVYRVNFRSATMTPNAIAANWADLAEPRQPVSTADVEKAARRSAQRQWAEEQAALEATT